MIATVDRFGQSAYHSSVALDQFGPPVVVHLFRSPRCSAVSVPPEPNAMVIPGLPDGLGCSPDPKANLAPRKPAVSKRLQFRDGFLSPRQAHGENP